MLMVCSGVGKNRLASLIAASSFSHVGIAFSFCEQCEIDEGRGLWWNALDEEEGDGQLGMYKRDSK